MLMVQSCHIPMNLQILLPHQGWVQQKKLVQRKDLRVATLNVGSMTGRGREVAFLLERKKVHIVCVQETERLVEDL